MQHFFAVFLVLMFSPLVALGQVTLNLTLQNQRIMCWGASGTIGTGADPGESYPEHLGRILGRGVDKHLGGLTRDCLSQINMFEEDRYGIIICQFGGRDFRGEVPLQEIEGNVRKLIQGLKATGAVVILWDHLPLWELDGQVTTTKEKCNFGIYTHPEIACGAIDDETQTARYYEAWGNMTIFHVICEEEGALFIPHSAFHDCIDTTCPPATRIHPDLMATDRFHLNSFGYGVFAERVAEYLVSWGLAEYEESKEEMSESLSSLMASAEASLKDIEERGLNTTKLRAEYYDMVQLLKEKGYLYTSRRMLRKKVLPLVDGVVEHWDEISEMFVNATNHIETTAQAGMDTGKMERDYGYAEKSWSELNYGFTKWYLQGILDTQIPEPTLLPLLTLLGLILLPTHRRHR